MISADAFWRLVDKSGDCWLWTGYKDRHGYGQRRCGGHLVFAHRLAYEFAVGPIPPGLAVCHRCDTPSCVRPDHLFTGTQQQNLQDMTDKGRRKNLPPQPGELHPRHRLSAADVAEIRRSRREDHATLQSLADRYGVTKSHIGNICSARRWAS